MIILIVKIVMATILPMIKIVLHGVNSLQLLKLEAITKLVLRELLTFIIRKTDKMLIIILEVLIMITVTLLIP